VAKNLADNASFHAWVKSAPSSSGIKQLTDLATAADLRKKRFRQADHLGDVGLHEGAVVLS
jgi:hypothetical protein